MPLEFRLSKQWQKRYKQKQKQTTKVTFLKKKKQEDIVQSWPKYVNQILVFMWNSTLQEKFDFLVLTKFWFQEEDWALG